eukprot:807572-Pleurochrysis_carterae.AAC.1
MKSACARGLAGSAAHLWKSSTGQEPSDRNGVVHVGANVSRDRRCVDVKVRKDGLGRTPVGGKAVT